LNPLVFHSGVAHALLQYLLIGWAVIEIVLRLRNLGGRTTFDWTFWLVVISVVAAINLGFMAAHVQPAVFGGGWLPVAAGLSVLAVGIALRTWSILTLGRLFKFVVVIQEDHRVVTTGPYHWLRHPSYTGGLIGFLGAGIALDNWLSVLALAGIPLLAILLRIRVEEAELARALGKDYRAYASQTRRLLPGIW